MKYTAPLLSLFLLGTLPRLAQAAVIWSGDFEPGNFSQWQGVTNEKKGDRVNIKVVEDLVIQGTKACRFEIHGDDDFANTQSRTQLTRRSERTDEGEDTYMAAYWRMPEDAKVRNQIQYWESGGNKNNVDFWIEPKAGGGTTINFGTGSLGKDKHWTADLTLNQWHLIAHHIHWSQNAAQGSISVWFDGALVVDAIKVATKPDDQALFTQLGFHRGQRNDLVDAIYLDGVIEADSEADLTSLPLPMNGGGGGSGGAGGMGGAAGATTGGVAGGGSPSAGMSGAGGAAAGAPAVTGGAGSNALAGAAGAAAGTAAVTPPQTTEDAGGCSLRASHGRQGPTALLMAGALLLLRRSRERPTGARRNR